MSQDLNINDIKAYSKPMPFIKIGDEEYLLNIVLKLVHRIIETDEHVKYDGNGNYFPCNILTTAEFCLCKYFVSIGKLYEAYFEADRKWQEDILGFSKEYDTDKFWDDFKNQLETELKNFK